MKKAHLIAAFPGTGKTTYYRQNKSKKVVLDSDSSKFDKSKFPENYMNHIKNNINRADVILISSHKVVRDTLVANDLKFTLIYPHWNLKDEYLTRYESRGDPFSFIDLMYKNWGHWISECEEQKGCEHIVLPTMIFIADVFNLE